MAPFWHFWVLWAESKEMADTMKTKQNKSINIPSTNCSWPFYTQVICHRIVVATVAELPWQKAIFIIFQQSTSAIWSPYFEEEGSTKHFVLEELFFLKCCLLSSMVSLITCKTIPSPPPSKHNTSFWLIVNLSCDAVRRVHWHANAKKCFQDNFVMYLYMNMSYREHKNLLSHI